MNVSKQVGRVRRFAVACASALLIGVVPTAFAEDASSISPAAKAVVDFDKAGVKPSKPYRIGYLTECVDNAYCLARLAGLKAAAEKYGFTFKIFDAAFNRRLRPRSCRTRSRKVSTATFTGPRRPHPAAASTSAS